jgi:AcrR family transcriptional regulator
MSDDEVSLRERTRRAVRNEIAHAAMGLFMTHGFESTTVEQIAQSAGISRRSFFRYFASKDEALAAGLAAIGDSVAEALADRPESENPWLALRRAFDVITNQATSDASAAALGRLLLERPAVQLDKTSRWSAAIAVALAPRLASAAPIESEALTASAIACLHVAQGRWLDADEHTSLGELLDSAMAAVRPFA